MRRIISGIFLFITMPVIISYAETPIKQCNTLFNQGQYEDAIAVCLPIAEGNPEAAHHVGVIYFLRSLNWNTDPTIAIKYLTIAAKKRNVDAQVFLASILSTKGSTSQSMKEAVKWYKQAVSKDNSRAQFGLAQMYQDGKSVKKDIKQAIALYKKSARQGETKAKVELMKVAEMFQTGVFGEKDVANAEALYDMLARLGWPQAQYKLARMYELGHGARKDIKQAASLYLKAVQQGNIKAKYHLARLYELGNGVKKDLEQAFALYQDAQWYLPEAQYHLARMYELGHGVRKDMKQAVTLYQKAAQQGFAEAQYHLARRIYERGNGEEKDHSQKVNFYRMAVLWYRKSADQGNVAAQMQLADMYSDGLGVEKDPLVALKLYQKLWKNGDLGAKKKIDVVLSHELKNAKHGDKRSQFVVGVTMLNDIESSKNEIKGLAWIIRAKNNGYAVLKVDDHIVERIFFALSSSELLQQCLDADYFLLTNQKYNDAISRYGKCAQDATRMNDVLSYQNFGEHLFHWVLANAEISGDKAVHKYNTQKHIYDQLHSNDKRKKNKSGKENKITGSLLETVVDGPIGAVTGYFHGYIYSEFKRYFADKSFELQHPLPTLDSKTINRKLILLNQSKHLLLIRKNYIKNIMLNAGKEDLMRLTSASSVIDQDERILKRSYNIFVNAYVVRPILERTDQLLFIADKEKVWGADEDRMEEAAKMYGRLNKRLIMTASKSNKDFARKILSKFKSLGGKEMMTNLEVVQALNGSDQDHSGADSWLETN